MVPLFAPGQTPGSDDISAEGDCVTLSVTDCVLTQPDAFVPVTVYVVVVEGVAIVTEPLVTERSVAGDHTYVLAPDAVSVELVPLQKLVEVAEMFIVGSGFTV